MRTIFTVIILGFLGLSYFPNVPIENEIPSLLNTWAVMDTVTKTIEISYEISDREDKVFNINCKVSLNRGATYISRKNEIYGDVGKVLEQGKKKTIYWAYQSPKIKLDDLRILLTIDDGYSVPMSELINQVSSQELKNNLDRIYGIRDHSKKSLPHLERVKNLIEEQATDCKLLTKREAFSSSCSGENIINTKHGVGDSKQVYIVCAHFDTAKRSPGADDNATGVAGMLEIMRVLSAYNFTYGIQFIAFDCEESDLTGSRVFVNKIDNSYEEQIKGLVNLDMIGYYSDQPGSQIVPEKLVAVFPEAYQYISENDFKGDFVLSLRNDNSIDLGDIFSSTAQEYVPELKIISLDVPVNGDLTPSLVASDHAPFWNAGYKAIQLGDGAYSRNSATNSARDKIDKIHLGFMENIVKATVTTLATLAEIKHCSQVELTVNY